MSSESVVGPCTTGPVKLLEVWFSPDLQVEKNWVKVSSRVNYIVKTWS